MYLCNGRYKVTGLLGSGGFGRVYLARDQRLNKRWAVKQTDIQDPAARNAAKAELAVLTQVSHPNIVRITDVFSDDDHIYIVMDHVEGMTLREIISNKKQIPEKLFYKWSMEICDAVSYLHNMKPPVILCDLKESNIIIKPDGHPVLIDFGGASNRLLSGGEGMFGSPGYVSPEQKKGHADARSDIYALGKILKDMTGGEGSFLIRWIIRKCRQEEADRRFKSVKAVKKYLILAKNLYRLIIALLGLLLVTLIIIIRVGGVREAAYEKIRSDQSFEQGVVYLSEYRDSEKAAKCFEAADPEAYPEAGLYEKVIRIMDSPDSMSSNSLSVLSELERFNSSGAKDMGDERYIRNAICIATLYREALKGTEGYEGAKRVLINLLDHLDGMDGRDEEKRSVNGMISDLLVEQGMSDETVREGNYKEAIGYIYRSYELDLGGKREDECVSDLMDIAALYTETGEYDRAIEIYEKAESEFPDNRNLRIFSHLTLMMQKGYPAGDVIRVWCLTENIPGIKEDANYEYMKERVVTYE